MPFRSWGLSLMAMLVCSVATHADLVLFEVNGDVKAPASPLLGASFQFKALVPFSTAPLQTAVNPDDIHYDMTSISSLLKITGSASSDGYYTPTSTAIVTAVDEQPGSPDYDSLTYAGLFNISLGSLEFHVIGFFANPLILANVASQPPVFSTSDAFLVVGSHSIDGGIDYLTSDMTFSATVVPDGTSLPEASSLTTVGLASILLAGIPVVRRRMASRRA